MMRHIGITDLKKEATAWQLLLYVKYIMCIMVDKNPTNW